MKRPLRAIVCTGVAVMSVDAMVSTSTSTASRTTSVKTSSVGSFGISKTMPQAPRTSRKAPSKTAYDRYHEDHDEDRDEWDDDDYDMEFEVTSFQELQRSTGSEILDSGLQGQIDQASDYPNLFLDAHMSDASYMEKVAMASIPEQLPQPAVNALRNTNNQASRGLNFASCRVSPEEEIELGKMIQQGVQLHGLRSDFEANHSRKPSRSEWAQVAGLDSAKQLRRLVANYRKAKQLLVSANMGLVHTVVKSQYHKIRKSGLTFDELVQEGSLGLLRAAELFDPNRGLRFSTYATIWIKGQLSNSHVVEPIVLPQREKTKWNKINRAHYELIEENGGASEPTVEELADHVGMSVSDVMATKRKMSQVSQVLSLDYQYSSQSRSGTESSSSLNLMDKDKNFRADVDLAERTQMHADVVAAMARNLDAREARLMRLRYGLTDGRQRSLAECADAMGISQTYAQNIASRCLKKLREASEAESLEEYLLTIA
jgi:RNA polymerase primary sigma factor